MAGSLPDLDLSPFQESIPSPVALFKMRAKRVLRYHRGERRRPQEHGPNSYKKRHQTLNVVFTGV
jgi:hypothetical protein